MLYLTRKLYITPNLGGGFIMKKRLISSLVCLSLLATLFVGCGKEANNANNSNNSTSPSSSSAAAGDTKLVGVSMPTKDLQRWNQDGANMEKELTAAGYEVDLQYASNDVQTQVNQIENMIAKPVSLLVIVAIDGDSLGTVVDQAKEKNIPVIAYDRLIKNSDAVSYYATFDNYKVGTTQGQYLEKALDLPNAAGPFNLEIVAGDPGDNNAKFFYNGAMDVLKPYIDSGKLVVKSKQVDFATVATATWATETAQARMETIISSFYADGTKLDAVLCSNDSTALGATNALTASYKGEWPLITGQDCDIANVKNMIAGKQAMSVFKDTRTLASQVLKMINSVMKGEKVEVNDEKTYDNGKKVVPTYQCEPVFADKDNYKELLIDSGYYTEDQLK